MGRIPLMASVVAGVALGAFALFAGSATANGTALEVVQVTSTPGPHVLARGKLNTVIATTDLAFRVRVRNFTSSRQHTQITLRINRPQSTLGPISRTATLVFDPHQARTFTFRKLGNVPFAQRDKLTVFVENGAKHWVSYPVIFALG